MKSFLKDLFSVGISKMLMIFFGIFTSIIVARTLGPEKNGIIAALLVYPNLFMSIGSLGIRQSTTYFVGKKIFHEDQIKTAISQIWFLTTCISVITIYLLLTSFSSISKNFLMVIFAILPLPFSLFNTYSSGIFLGKNKIGEFNKINWIPSFITFTLTYLFLVILNYEIEGYLLALVGGPFFIFLILFKKTNFHKYLSINVNRNLIKKMLSLGSVYALALFAINLNYSIDIIILEKLSNSFELGIYSKGASVTQYLWQIPMLLSTIIFARSATSKNDFEFSLKVSKLLRVSFLFILLGGVILFLFSNQIIHIMYGEKFIGSVAILNILLPGVIFLTVFKVMNTDLAGKGKPLIALKSMVPSLLVNVILNVIFIPKMGAKGAALASTISYSFAAILFLIQYSNEVKIPIKTILTYSKSDFDPILKLLKLIK
ncbi:MAG: flippase [Flavobacterium sp.]